MRLFLISMLLFLSFSFVCEAGGGTITADFSASSATVNVGENVVFTDETNFSGACDGIGSTVTYSWNFGTGATPPTLVQTDNTANHDDDNINSGNVSYSTFGQKTITLQVEHSSGACNTDNPDIATEMIIVVGGAIPTLSEWGLILLALLLMNLGAVAIAQEKLSLATPRKYSIPFTRMSMPFSNTYFSKAILVTAIFAFVGFAASVFLTGTIAASDLIGVFVTAPVFAYLVHLLLVLKDK